MSERQFSILDGLADLEGLATMKSELEHDPAISMAASGASNSKCPRVTEPRIDFAAGVQGLEVAPAPILTTSHNLLSLHDLEPPTIRFGGPWKCVAAANYRSWQPWPP